KRCNTAAVDLEPVEGEDEKLLRSLIEAHVEATGSPRGEWILENWAEMLPKFIKVFPHEYKRVLGISRTTASAKIVPVAPAVAIPQMVEPRSFASGQGGFVG